MLLLTWERAQTLSCVHSPTTSYLAEGPVAQGAGLASTPRNQPLHCTRHYCDEHAVQTQVGMAYGSSASAMLKSSLARDREGIAKVIQPNKKIERPGNCILILDVHHLAHQNLVEEKSQVSGLIV